MASALILLLLTTLAFVGSNGASIDPRISDSHNIEECDASTDTTQLLATNLYESGQFLGVVKRTFRYPEVGQNTVPIKCLKVTNLDSSTHGGYPHVVSGGYGSTSVELLITSQLGQPLNFRIEIYG